MTSDYAPDGVVGIAVPQANPVVEPELRVLLPPTVGLLATRLVSDAADPAGRLRDYAASVDRAVASFDTAPVRVLGFACTAACYLLGVAREAELFEAAGRRAGYPVLPATGAVAGALRVLGATRIALVTPYPPELDDAAVRYWTDRGVTVTARQRVETGVPDTRAIYAQPGAAAVAAVAALEPAGAHAVLVSGTGLASLDAVRSARTDLPVISANLCLAWTLLRRLGLATVGGPESALLAGWSGRLAAARGNWWT